MTPDCCCTSLIAQTEKTDKHKHTYTEHIEQTKAGTQSYRKGKLGPSCLSQFVQSMPTQGLQIISRNLLDVSGLSNIVGV